MNLDEILKIIESGDIKKLKADIESDSAVSDIAEAIKQYNPIQHDVMDPTKRKDKRITDKAGKDIGLVKVARLPLALQKKIVLTASAFLGSPTIKSTPKGAIEEKMVAGIEKIWDSNKMHYRFSELMERAMSEKQSAILWYTQEAEEGYWEGTNISSNLKLRSRILSPILGDLLYPVYDDFGDMVAFGRSYKIKKAAKEYEYFDLYTADMVYFTTNETGEWVLNPLINKAGKIPVIYFEHALAWEDVQLLINRLEEIFSKLADTNDYNGSPIMKASGEVKSMSDKGDAGKLVELENGATLEYLTYNSLPESVKMEVENLFKLIYGLTHTPDISFENLKNLGYFSTSALKTMFSDAHLKARHNERVFGEGAQRIINFNKAVLAGLDTSVKAALAMQIKPLFSYYMPDNFEEDLRNISTALTIGIISKESAIKLNPLVEDVESELEAIKLEMVPASANPTVIEGGGGVV